MPGFPVIDTHLHIWDQSRVKLSAFEGSSRYFTRSVSDGNFSGGI